MNKSVMNQVSRMIQTDEGREYFNLLRMIEDPIPRHYAEVIYYWNISSHDLVKPVGDFFRKYVSYIENGRHPHYVNRTGVWDAVEALLERGFTKDNFETWFDDQAKSIN